MSSQRRTSVSVVPWLNPEQFKKVYNCLFSDEITKKRWAIDTISVWDTRCHPSLPTAIEATYVLTSAVVQDILYTNNTTLIHHMDLQGIYGSAITRFVSLTVEVNKNKECPFYSISEVAKLIGIPSFIVDLRNELCHSARPPLPMLRSATQLALQYLKESYWDKEAAYINICEKQHLDETNLRELFEHFIKYHRATLMKTQVKVIQSEGGLELHPDYKLLMRGIEKYLKNNKRLFIKVLIADGIFIPKGEDLKDVIDHADYASFENDYSLDDDSDEVMNEEGDVENDFQKTHFPELPCGLEELWHPIIGLLNKYEAMPLFMENLLKTQGDRTVVGQKIIIAWIDRLLSLHSPYSYKVNSPDLKRIFRHKGILLNWLHLLHAAMVNPCKYTLHILPLIMNYADLKKEYVHHIIGLISIKLGMIPSGCERMNFWKLHYDSNDFKRDFEYKRNKERRMEEDDSNEDDWLVFPDDSSSLWPIGSIINAVADDEDGDEEEEENEEIFQYPFRRHSQFPSNKNEDDEDEDDVSQAWKMDEELDIDKVINEIRSKGSSILYELPTEQMLHFLRD